MRALLLEVSPIASELLSSAHKYPVPSGMLHNGCQLDRESLRSPDMRPQGYLEGEVLDLVEVGISTVSMGGIVPCAGVLDWKGD